MKTIVLIEEDQHYQNEVNAAVHELDHQNKFITFKNLKEFYSWFSKLLTNDNNQKEEKKDHIDLIIADFDSFKDVSLKLLVKTQKALVEKHLGDEEIPPSFIITTHETPEFHIESYLHSIIANILYKPFDRLILKESIHNALNGRKPIDSSLYRQKSNASIDMIKLVDITGLTELGFRTRATRPLAHGEIAKYYGEVFKDHKVDFTYAYCYNCSPHGEGYQCNFSYFGIGMEQISAMRRYIHSLKDRKPMILEDAKEVHPSENNVYIITQNIDDYKKISILISDNFSNVKCIPIFRFEYLIARLKDSSGTQKKTASNDKILKSENIHRLTLKKQKVIKFQEIDQKGEPKDLVQFGSLKIEDLKNNSTELNKYFPEETFQKIFKNPETLTANDGIVDILENDMIIFFKIFKINKTVDENMEEILEIDFSSVHPDEAERIRHKKFPVTGQTSAIFLDGIYASPEYFDRVKGFMSNSEPQNKEYRIIALSNKPLLDEKDEIRYGVFDECFCLPTDRYYFARKMKQDFPYWKIKANEPLSRDVVEYKGKIKAAKSIKVESLSETFLILNYHRALPVGEIREFKLKIKNEIDAPEILAMCNYCEKINDKQYTLHFLFFGISAEQRQHIRRWMKQQYLSEKGSEG